MRSDDVKWVTINHVHVPIENGKSKDEAVQEFLTDQERKNSLKEKSNDEVKNIQSEEQKTTTSEKVPKELLDYCNTLTDEQIIENNGWLTKKGEDKIMKEIIGMQGYNALPEVVSEAEIKSLIDEGYIGFMRGMRVENGAELYRSGEMYIGRGASGSGVYTAAFTNNGRYTDQATAVKTARKYAGAYDDPYTGSILVGALSKEAKIISKAELGRIKEDLLPNLPPKAQGVFANSGRLAVALGYDAIDCDNNAYILILNRGKTIVAK